MYLIGLKLPLGLKVGVLRIRMWRGGGKESCNRRKSNSFLYPPCHPSPFPLRYILMQPVVGEERKHVLPSTHLSIEVQNIHITAIFFYWVEKSHSLKLTILKWTIQWHLVPFQVFYSHSMGYIFSSILKVTTTFCIKKHQKNNCLEHFEHCLSTKSWVDL